MSYTITIELDDSHTEQTVANLLAWLHDRVTGLKAVRAARPQPEAPGENE